MGQGSSQPADLQENEEFENDGVTENAQDIMTSPAVSKGSKTERHESTTKRKRKSSQSAGGTSSSATAPSEQSPKAKRKKVVDELATNTSPTSEQPPKPIKRKRIVDNLTTNVAPAPARRKETKVSSSKISSSNTAKSSALRDDYKASPSPAISTLSALAKGRLNMSNGTLNAKGATGAFKPAEVEALEDFKIRFCNSNGCSAAAFDLMVQHGSDGDFPGVNGIKKRIFWRQVHEILPERDRRSVYRFMKRHFQASGQKPHEWTPQQDDDLVALYKEHGPKWAQIAEDLGRSADDVVQRWKNRLEHRATMNTGPWSDAELRLLKKLLREVWSRMKAEGYNVGENIYEMDESLISWGQMSTRMGHIRSRQQCADKWRNVRANMSGPGSREQSRANSRSISRGATPASSGKTASNGKRKPYQSSAYVDSEDDEPDMPGHGEHERQTTFTPLQSTEKRSAVPTIEEPSASEMQKQVESSQGESESESSSGSERSDSDSDSEPGSASEPKKQKPPAPPAVKVKAKTGVSSEPAAKKRSAMSSDSASDESESSSDEESDSDSSEDGSEKSTQQQKVSEATQPVKQENISDESSDSSSSDEESDSDSEGEGKDQSTAQYYFSRRKPEGRPANEAKTHEDNAVQIKKESTSEDNSDDSDKSDDKSRSSVKKQQTKSAPRDTSSETETDAEESDNNRGPNAIHLRDASTESANGPPIRKQDMDTSSTSDSSDSSDSESEADTDSEAEDDVKAIKIEGGEESATDAPIRKRENDSSTSEGSDSSDSSSEADTESEDEEDVKTVKIDGRKEAASDSPVIKQENDPSSSSDSESSDSSDSGSEADTDSDSE